MDKQLTKEDIKNAKQVDLYNNSVVFVVMPDDEAYGHSLGGGDWYHKENYWDYWESSIMLRYFSEITKEEVLALMDKWEKQKTRTIESLFEDNDRVWFYIPDEWKECFYNEITQVGAKFMDGSDITKDSIGTLMGIGKDKSVGYISNLVWYNTFFTDNAAVKVYYDKFKDASDDYLITEPNIKPLDIEEL